MERVTIAVLMRDGTEYRPTVGLAEKIAGEDAQIGSDKPMRLMAFWCWHSMNRWGMYARDFESFLTECEDFAPVEGGEITVNPTTLGIPRESGLPSPISTPARPPFTGASSHSLMSDS